MDLTTLVKLVVQEKVQVCTVQYRGKEPFHKLVVICPGHEEFRSSSGNEVLRSRQGERADRLTAMLARVVHTGTSLRNAAFAPLRCPDEIIANNASDVHAFRHNGDDRALTTVPPGAGSLTMIVQSDLNARGRLRSSPWYSIPMATCSAT